MAGPSFNFDSATPLLITSSTNAIDILPLGSSNGTSSTFGYSQHLQFQILRQNVIIPDGTFTDPRVAVPVGTNFTSSATHNRILVTANVTFQSFVGSNPNTSSAYGSVPMIFGLLGAASGVSANGFYTSGDGTIYQASGGYAWRPAKTTDIPETFTRTITFTTDLIPGTYSSASTVTPVNMLVQRMAKYIKLNGCPQLDLTLIRF
jgi:hypothetical protein